MTESVGSEDNNDRNQSGLDHPMKNFHQDLRQVVSILQKALVKDGFQIVIIKSQQQITS